MFFAICMQAVKIMFALVSGLYVLYLFYLLVRAYAELRSMPYFGEYIDCRFTIVATVISFPYSSYLL